MIASGHVDVCYWQGDHRSDHKGKLRGRRGHPKKAAAGEGLVPAAAADDGCASRVYVMSIRRPIIHVVTRPFAKKSSYFWHKVQSDSGNTSITHSSWTVVVLNEATHGLRTPNEVFFHWNPERLGLGKQIGQINSGAFGIFLAELSAPILVQWVPCPCFPLFNHYFYKKLSLYVHIPNIYLGLGFEFGPRRIRDLAFVCL